jgi:uncharacterized protein YfaS (alpha-2-macroglobulin family)
MKRVIATLALGLLVSFVSFSAPLLQVSRVTPGGDAVTTLKQIVIEFNQPVVPLGDMKRSAEQIPVTITPAVNCEWRWLNASSLACNLSDKNALNLATTYKVTVNPGLEAVDHARMSGPYTHEFTTQRADIAYTTFDSWKSPVHPRLQVETNQPVTLESLQQVLSFTLPEGKVEAKVEEIIATPEEQKNQTYPPHTRWWVDPIKDLPAETRVKLQLSPGLVSTLGPVKSVTDRVLMEMDTFADFKFIGFQCTTLLNETVLITADKVQGGHELCDPLRAIQLVFNNPVSVNTIKQGLLFSPALSSNKEHQDEENTNDDNQYALRENHINEKTRYYYRLPNLKPVQEYTLGFKAVNESEPELKDLFGRPLTTTLAARIKTDHLKSAFTLPYETAILELNEKTYVPVFTTNLKNLDIDYRGFTSLGDIKAHTAREIMPADLDKEVSTPLKIREKLQGRSGVLYADFDKDNHLFAEVTPYQLHVKLGHFNTLVWVTDLASGEVVKNAKVTLYEDSFTQLQATNTPLATAKTNQQGIALLPGTDEFDPKLDRSHDYWEQGQKGLFIRVDKNDQLAVLPISYDFLIDSVRASEGTVGTVTLQKFGHMRAWGTTAQGIYRAGDTIQYKIYVRNQNNKTLTPAPREGYTLQIEDPTGKVIQSLPKVKLSEFGALVGEYTLPKQTAIGWYQFTLLLDNHSEKTTLYPLQVLVTDFTPAPFKVTQELNGDSFQAGATVTLTTHATLHSGGAYAKASTRITASLNAVSFTPKTPITQGFNFTSADNTEESYREVYQKENELNEKGELISQFTLPAVTISYGKLKVESAVQDDRGKNIATTQSVDYIGVDRFVGLKQTEWLASTAKPVDMQYIVVDVNGKPVANTPVALHFEYKETVAARVKDVGVTYSTHYTAEWKDYSDCQGTSAAEPQHCEFKPTKAGEYRVTATIKDTQGRSYQVRQGLWVSGSDAILWEEPNENFLQIMPEKAEYAVGETARFLVKNPFPKAKALITVERYGVLDHFQQTFSTSAPVIEIPVKADYLPGFYLSVTIQTPRVDKPLGEGNIDLGKPTFRMGYVSVPVVDRHKEMRVTTTTDKPVYRPRDKVKLTIHAEPKIKPDQQEPVELAVAVLDDGVFDLLTGGNKNYDPYWGLYQFDPLDVRTYSLLTRLIGRQKVDKKGANPGGDGGFDIGVRNAFKFVSYWNPSLATDKEGNATVEFSAPDNLTGWRVLVMAVTPSDRAGLGGSEFKVNRPTEIRPAMPNQIIEGDQFKAKFTVMNRTDKPRDIAVSIHADGDIDSAKTPADYTETVKLGAYERATVTMPVVGKTLSFDRERPTGSIKFTLRAGDAQDSDAMTHTLTILKNRTLDVAANYGTTDSYQVSEPIAFPKAIYPDSGSLSFSLSPTVITSVEGAFRYMRDYPYYCWEQRLTKGMLASQYQQLKAYIPSSFTWEESVGLPTQTLSDASNFQAPNGGMGYFVASDDRVDPYLSAFTALAFQWLREDGKTIPAAVEKKLQAYLDNYLRHEVSPSYYSPAMTKSVRITALAALSLQGKTTLADITRLQDNFGSLALFDQAMLIQAALNTPEADPLARKFTDELLTHSTQSSGKFLFSDSNIEGYDRLLSSPLRDNCAALDTLVSVAQKEGLNRVGDVPFKLVRSIMETRKSRDYWENTQENLFCLRALTHYSRVYEKTAPDMTVKVSLDKDTIGTANFKERTAAPITLTRPIEAGDPGRKATAHIERMGQGRLYYVTRLSTAPLPEAEVPANAGMDLKREYSVLRNKEWVLLSNPLQLHKGEVVRVDLYLSLPKPANFVVVNDPIPGALEPVNSELATTSSVDDAGTTTYQPSKGSTWFKYKLLNTFDSSPWGFYYKELHHEAARFYSDYLEAGNYHLYYTAQVVAEGTFMSPAAKAEEMYDPEVYGRDVSVKVVVD